MNKALRLTEDLKEYPMDIVKRITKWIEDGIPEKVSKEKWENMFDESMVIIGKKGDIFFRSKIYSEDGEYFLYPYVIDPKVIKRKDVSLGLGLFYESNPFKNWRHYLTANFDRFKKGKFEECDTALSSFEEIYIVEALNVGIDLLEKDKDKLNNDIKLNRDFIDKILKPAGSNEKN